MTDNPNCCGNGPHDGPEVRVLPLSRDSNLILCKACFSREILWRASRVKQGVYFDLPEWEDLKVYPDEEVAQPTETHELQFNSKELKLLSSLGYKITIHFKHPGKPASTHELLIENHPDGLVQIRHKPDKDHTDLNYYFNV